MSTQAHLEANRRYYYKHKVRVAECSRRYYQANKEKILSRNAEWVRKNPEKVKAVKASYRQRHPDRVREIKRASREKNMEAVRRQYRMKKHRRKERMRNVPSCDKTSANVLYQLVSDAAKLTCGICGKNMPKNDRTIDHVIPLSKGGSGEIWNLRIVHMLCNSKKNSKMPDELNFHTP